MITIIMVDEKTETLWARAIDADAASGDLVFPGIPADAEIRKTANDELAAPESGSYAAWDVAWIETPPVPED